MSAFAIYLAWGFNKIFVPYFSVNGYNIDATILGLVLGLEGITGMIVDPLSGIYTDKDIFHPASTKGRFIAIGLVVMSISIFILPFSQTLAEFILVLLVLYIAAHFIRPPYNSLMPEVVRRRDWGEASGFINAFLALGSITAFLVVGLLISTSLIYAAFAAGTMILLIGLVTPATIRESPNRKKTFHRRRSIRNLLQTREIRTFFLMQLFWWASYESVATYLYYFVKNLNLSLTPGGSSLIYAAIAFAVFNVATVLSSIAIGKIYARTLNKKNLIGIGLVIFMLTELLGSFYQTSDSILLFLAVAGVGWAFILTASYPLGAYLVKKFAGENSPLGAFFGLNSFFGNLAIIIGAFGTAAVLYLSNQDLEVMFPIALLCSFVAFMLLQRLKITDEMNRELMEGTTPSTVPLME